MGTKIFDLVTLTLMFDLLLKNFNLGHSFLTRRVRTFILHMYIPCDKTFPWVPIFFYLLTLTLKFDLLLKNFNLGNSFLTRIGRVILFHMCIPCSKTFNAVP